MSYEEESLLRIPFRDQLSVIALDRSNIREALSSRLDRDRPGITIGSDILAWIGHGGAVSLVLLFLDREDNYIAT